MSFSVTWVLGASPLGATFSQVRLNVFPLDFYYSRAAASLMMVWVGIVLVVVQGTFVSLVNSSFIKAMPLGF